MNNTNGTAFFIALRYLFSSKKHNIINLISIISVVGIMASAAALIIVLSVYNGFQEFVVGNFNRFNPPLKIEVREGKVFSLKKTQFTLGDLENVEGISAVEQEVSDLVLVTYKDKQMLATLHGVSKDYPDLSGLSQMTVDGNFDTGTATGIVFGYGIAQLLGIELAEYVPVELYYPKRNKPNLLNPLDAFQKFCAPPVGVFASFTPYDEQSVFVSIGFAKEIMEYDSEISCIAIYLDGSVASEKVQKQIEQITGADFNVLNQMQQEPLLFKTIQTENIVIFLILGFIFLISAFNIIGILGMLIIEKKQDISILHTLGAETALLKKVFLITGTMIGFFGGFLGVSIGFICCVVQQYFGIISLGNNESSFLISAYPVSLDPKDFVITFFLIIVTSLLTSWFSLRGLKNTNLINKY